MDPVTQKAALERGRAQEKQGKLEEAFASFKAAAAPDDTARVLIALRRFSEAAPILLSSAGMAPGEVGKVTGLDAVRKKKILMAGICYANAGEIHRAVELFLKLGERQRAVETLTKVGDHAAVARIQGVTDAELPNISYAVPAAAGPAQSLAGAQKLEAEGKIEPAFQLYLELKQFGHAARLAHALKRPGQAAELFGQAGMPYEAAVCYREAGDNNRCLECLLKVPRDDKRYRNACLHAIKIGVQLNVLDFNLEHFLTKFVTAGPQDDREVEAFLLLAGLYKKHDFVENAKDCYVKVLTAKPGHREASTRLGELEEENKASAMVYEKILKEEQAFRTAVAQHSRPHALRGPSPPADDSGLPDLPDLPDLPQRPAGGYPTPVQGVPVGVPAGINLQSGAPKGGGSALTAWVPKTQYAGISQQGGGGVPTGPMAPLGSAGTVAATPQQAAAMGMQTPNPQMTPPPYATPPPASPYGDPNAGPRVQGIVEGAIVVGRYRLEKKIGQGGMASVYRAHDMELEEDIAVKFFAAGVADEQMLARFKQEVTLSRQLNHAHIIRLYDIGTYGDYKYITMELLKGNDLNKYMGGQPIDFSKGIEFLIQACNALELVHKRGVIHRDIKPDNFFITEDEQLKVMDFGIAKRQGAQGMTVAGMIAGTPEYMSPEQINDLSSVTKATDLYALGVMAYQMFTGTLPFQHAELMPLLVMHVTQAPDPPRSRNAKVPPGLEGIILKLLEKDPADRIQTCVELAKQLADVQKAL